MVHTHEAYTKHRLYDAMPGFIEKHWPKNNTAATGGPTTPGRGEAMAAIAMFIAELPDGEPLSDAWAQQTEQAHPTVRRTCQ